MKIPIDLEPDEYLRVMRARLEMTQAQFAKHLGVARGTITRYEIGESKIPLTLLDSLKRMAETST